MKFKINREEFVKELSNIVRVIENKQTMPILSNVLINVSDDGKLSIISTDLEIQIRSHVQLVLSFYSGSITVPGKKLFEICKSLPSKSIIKIDLVGENKISIISGKSKFSLSCLPAANYPEFAESHFDHQLFINAGKLKKALDKTLFCMANQDVRYYLNGLLLHVSNSKIKVVTSDGHRLSVYEDNLDHPSGFEARIILPRKGVLELSRLLDNPDIELKIEFSSNNIRIFIKHLVFSAKLVDSKYPDFTKVFRQEFFDPISIQKLLLKDALNRVAILSNEKFKGVTFDISSESLRISTHNPDHDEAEEELIIDYSGDPLTIAFNAQYLLDAVSNLDSDLAILTIACNASSCFIDEAENCGYKFIVMPMRM